MTYIQNKALYLVYVVNDFAERYALSIQSAYQYLHRFKGIDFIDKYYDAEHLLSMEQTLEDVVKVCRANGGGLV